MEPAAEPRPVKQGRPAVVALIAFVVELVVIAALANQVVTKHLLNYSQNHPYAFPGRLVGALTTYQWRVSSQPGDRANEPLAHACLDLVVLALTVVLVLILTRGAVTFFRAFFGTWLAVVVATLVGQIVFGLISPPPYPVTYSHLQGAVFLVPNGFGLVAGLVLGFVTALFAGIFAVATRRTIRPAVTGPLPSERPSDRPYLADYDNDTDNDDESRRGYLRDSEWSERTTAYPREEYGGYYGGQVGAPPAPPYQSAGGYGGGYGSSGFGGRREPQGTERQAEQTQSLRTVADQNPPAEAGSPAQSSGHPTTTLPRTEAQPAEPVQNESAAAESAPAESAPAESAPAESAPAESESARAAEPAASRGSSSSAESTQVFPRPPDDEDMGQHPDHHDL